MNRLSLIVALVIVTMPVSELSSAQSAADPAKGVEWLPFQNALDIVKQSTKTKLLVDVYAPWCGWCSRLQSEVYSQKDIQDFLRKNFRVTRLNIDAVDDTLSFKGYTLSSAELAMGLGASGTPTTVFLDTDGEYITRLPGFLEPAEFLKVLHFIASDAYQTQSFEEFAGR